MNPGKLIEFKKTIVNVLTKNGEITAFRMPIYARLNLLNISGKGGEKKIDLLPEDKIFFEEIRDYEHKKFLKAHRLEQLKTLIV